MSHYTTFEERLEIENGFRENLSFGEIANRLNKDRSTISREVRKHALPEKSGYGSTAYNACVHRSNCTKTHICTGHCRRQSVKYCT
jgi:IS30 family transposase